MLLPLDLLDEALRAVDVDRRHRVPDGPGAPHGLPAILRERIAAGEWSTGPLPSVKQLQGDHGVGRDTALRALDILRSEGLVFTVPRRGTYVSRKQP